MEVLMENKKLLQMVKFTKLDIPVKKVNNSKVELDILLKIKKYRRN